MNQEHLQKLLMLNMSSSVISSVLVTSMAYLVIGDALSKLGASISGFINDMGHGCLYPTQVVSKA